MDRAVGAAGSTSFGEVLGVVVRTERRAKNLAQADLAAELGITQASFSRLEGGLSLFNSSQLRATARALGVTLTQLLDVAEQCAAELSRQGVHVADDRPAVRSRRKDVPVKRDAIRAAVGRVMARVRAAQMNALLAASRSSAKSHLEVKLAGR